MRERMNCTKALDLIQDYIDQDLKLGKRMLLERHIAACAGCRAEFRSYRALNRALRDIELEPVPAGFADGVIAEMRAAGHALVPAATARARRRFLGAKPVFAALVIIAGIFVSLPGLFGWFKSFAGRAAVDVTNAFIAVQQAAKDAEVVLDAAARDVRTLKTILDAVESLVYSTGTNLMLAVGGVFLIVTGIVVILLRRRRSSQHALHIF